MSDKVRSQARRAKGGNEELKAITIRIERDLYEIVHLVAGERQASFNDAIRFILGDWWEKKADRARYETFLRGSPERQARRPR
jgi:hypothetical protein